MGTKMKKQHITLVLFVLLFGTLLAQTPNNVERASRFQVVQEFALQGVADNLGSSDISSVNNDITLKISSEVENLASRYGYIRSNSQLENLGSRYGFTRSNAQIENLGSRYGFTRSNAQIEDLGI